MKAPKKSRGVERIEERLVIVVNQPAIERKKRLYKKQQQQK